MNTALYCMGTKRTRRDETHETHESPTVTRWATRPATATRRAKGGACSEGSQLPGGGIRVCGPGARGALTRDPTHASAHHGAMPSPQEPEERSQSVWAHVLRP